jgi:recombinational DNA repair protein (RecF pathway)
MNANGYYGEPATTPCAWCNRIPPDNYMTSRKTGRVLCCVCTNRLAPARKAAFYNPVLYGQPTHHEFPRLAEREA